MNEIMAKPLIMFFWDEFNKVIDEVNEVKQKLGFKALLKWTLTLRQQENVFTFPTEEFAYEIFKVASAVFVDLLTELDVKSKYALELAMLHSKFKFENPDEFTKNYVEIGKYNFSDDLSDDELFIILEQPTYLS